MKTWWETRNSFTCIFERMGSEREGGRVLKCLLQSLAQVLMASLLQSFSKAIELIEWRTECSSWRKDGKTINYDYSKHANMKTCKILLLSLQMIFFLPISHFTFFIFSKIFHFPIFQFPFFPMFQTFPVSHFPFFIFSPFFMGLLEPSQCYVMLCHDMFTYSSGTLFCRCKSLGWWRE